jgi:glycosyltransferase involved in cell wall biosynthesis
MIDRTVVLFTDSFPFTFAGEASFIEPELRHLVAAFRRVILVPSRILGARRPLPPGVEVEEGYAVTQPGRVGRATVRAALTTRLFAGGLAGRPATLLQPRALASLVARSGNAVRAAAWIREFIRRRRLDVSRVLFYTYWTRESTLGLVLLKRADPRIRVVARAHGYDLFHHRHSPAWIPCQETTLAGLDALFLVSRAGRDYLAERFPRLRTPMEVFPLGVSAGELSRASEDGVIRVVSCSFLVPVKRVDLLVDAIALAGRQRPDRQIEWHHLGGGALEVAVEQRARRELPANVGYHLHGTVPPEMILEFYDTTAVDVFVHVSASEGGSPVAIMEAQSHGIPVVATGVGGIPEIVSNENGTLLSPDPTPEEIAAALLAIADDPDAARAKRAASRLSYESRFDADVNFRCFVERLQALHETAAESL